MRGDRASVSIGQNSLLQDNVHVSASKEGAKVTIGESVYVGVNASLDGCTLKDNSFVGMGASVQAGATVESFAVVSAGAVIEAGTTVPSG